MTESAAVAQFLAADVLALADIAKTSRLDGIWLVRGESCVLQTPDGQMVIEPLELSGDMTLLTDRGHRPRVEVIELHSHAVTALLSLSGKPELLFEVHFSVDDEYSVMIRRPSPRAPKPAKGFCWMMDMFRRRLF